MAATLACIAGEEIYRQWDAGQIDGESLGPQSTPFGESAEIFRIDGENPFYLLPRRRSGMEHVAAYRVNSQANLYALKELGADCVLGWGPGGAITHNIAVGDLVILGDLIDLTSRRVETFFEDSPLGVLRQFPVFCTALRRQIADVLQEMKLVYHGAGTAAVRDGPRLETPAEVRMLTGLGAEVVSHTFVPEMFLAKELQMCYAAVCYVINYAETGSRYRPFAAGDLFGGLTQQSEGDRLAGAVGAMSQIAAQLSTRLAEADPSVCECASTMAANVEKYNLPDDWRQWFEHS
jgi:5'-methylthioadenosine phosphorylase